MAKKKETGSLSFEQTIEALNKKYGVGAVMTLQERQPKIDYQVISTGSIGFDYKVLGVGGFVKGKLYELMGWEGSGKSTICGHLTAECQKKGGKVVYIDGEHAVDKNYFKSLGVDTDNLLISQPSNGEEGFQIAMEMINTGEIDLVVIDSDSSLLPKKVIDGDIGDSAIGRKAILNSNAYPKLKNKLVEKDVCVVVISQYREKIGVMFGNPTTTQGGHALKFYADCRVEIARSLAKEDGEVIANATRIRTIKNKTFSPFKKCEFNIYYGEGIDKVEELMDIASELEIGRKYGKTYTFDTIKYDLLEFKDRVLSDEKFYNELRNKVIETLNKPEEKDEIVTTE
jgi:recombination protein RecA